MDDALTRCPVCGAAREADASFCEACGHDFTGLASPAPVPPGSPCARSAQAAAAGTTLETAAPAGSSGTTAVLPSASSDPHVARVESQMRQAPVRPQSAAAGDESPLDIGWTGPVSGSSAALAVDSGSDGCTECGQGHFADGYCDTCGAKQPNPRDHFAESPAEWLGGVCDIGARKQRNEDAMALLAGTQPLAHDVLVVCDGVSNSTNSDVASLAAARAAREVLDDPVPRAMGLPDAVRAAIERRLGEAVVAARAAVVENTPDPTDPTPPSCTFVAALVSEGLAVVGNVGDSRAYWLPDDPASTPVQLGADDSFAAEQIREGMPRKEAETGAHAHAITRWLGIDSPDDLTPHTASVRLDEDGWLLVCSDGLWNYCSEPADLRTLVAERTAGLGEQGRRPAALAQSLVDFANAAGGHDNITVALVRSGGTAPLASTASPAPVAPDGDIASTSAAPKPDGEVAPDGTVHD